MTKTPHRYYKLHFLNQYHRTSQYNRLPIVRSPITLHAVKGSTGEVYLIHSSLPFSSFGEFDKLSYTERPKGLVF